MSTQTEYAKEVPGPVLINARDTLIRSLQKPTPKERAKLSSIGYLTWGNVPIKLYGDLLLFSNPAMDCDLSLQTNNVMLYLSQEYHHDIPRQLPSSVKWYSIGLFPDGLQESIIKWYEYDELSYQKMNVDPFQMHINPWRFLARLWRVKITMTVFSDSPREDKILISNFPYFVRDPDRFIKVTGATLNRFRSMDSYQRKRKLDNWTNKKSERAIRYAAGYNL